MEMLLSRFEQLKLGGSYGWTRASLAPMTAGHCTMAGAGRSGSGGGSRPASIETVDSAVAVASTCCTPFSSGTAGHGSAKPKRQRLNLYHLKHDEQNARAWLASPEA
jgi:hypothetical protein